MSTRSQRSQKRSSDSPFAEVDEMLSNGEGKEAYEKLKPDAKQKMNVELLWRLGEACRIMGEEADTKNKRRKELLTEGQKYAVAALKQNEKHFNATKTAALATGSLAELLPISARLAQGCQFKVEKNIPAQWIDNLLWLAKAYIAKNDEKNAVKYLKQADAIEPVDDAERESLTEVKKLLRKYAYKEAANRDLSVKRKNPK